MDNVLDQEFREFAGEACAGVLHALSRALGASVRLLDAGGRPIVPAQTTDEGSSSAPRTDPTRVPIWLPARGAGGSSHLRADDPDRCRGHLTADRPERSFGCLTADGPERCLGYLTADAATPAITRLLADLAIELAAQFQAELLCDAEIDAIGALQAEIDLLDRMARARGTVRDLPAAAHALLSEHGDLLLRARLVACLTWREKLIWVEPARDEDNRSAPGAGLPTAWQERTARTILADLRGTFAAGETPTLLQCCIEEPTGRIACAFTAWRDADAIIGFVGILGIGPGQPLEPADYSVLRSLAGELSHAAVRHGRHRELRDMLFHTVLSLVAAVDAKDEYTRGHSERVHRLALRVGRALGVPAADLRRLSWAALLHDVGKIATPGELLATRTDLTEEEERLLRAHPVQGCELLEPIPQLRAVLPAIRHHHERYDGHGYPDGLAGDAIPLHARIIAVAEAFDAMLHAPCAIPRLDAAEALRAIEQGVGTRFDPDVVRALLQVINEQAGAPGSPVHEDEDLLPPDLQADDGDDLAAA